MGIVQLILGLALQVLFWSMWVRFFVEVVRSSNPSWRPKGIVLPIAEIALTLTDPLVKLVRRFVPTIRVGMLGLDFGWTIAMIVILIAQGLVSRIA